MPGGARTKTMFCGPASQYPDHQIRARRLGASLCARSRARAAGSATCGREAPEGRHDAVTVAWSRNPCRSAARTQTEGGVLSGGESGDPLATVLGAGVLASVVIAGGFVLPTPGAAGVPAVPIRLGMWLGEAAQVMVCSVRGMRVVLRGIGWSAGGGQAGIPVDLPPAGPTAGDAQLWGAFRVVGAARGAGPGVGACGGSRDGHG